MAEGEELPIKMGLIMITSEISDGSMGIVPGLLDAEVFANKERFCKQICIDPARLVRGEQTHGTNVAVVRDIPAEKIPDTDALVTNLPNIYLGIITADCAPVFVWDENSKVVGIVHAGWKGMLAGAIPATIKTIEREYEVEPSSLRAKIGPCIRPCHHTIDKEHPDLAKTAKEQMVSLGLMSENISDSMECTFCLKDKYFSLRRDRSEEFPRGKGNMLSVIGLRK